MAGRARVSHKNTYPNAEGEVFLGADIQFRMKINLSCDLTANWMQMRDIFSSSDKTDLQKLICDERHPPQGVEIA